MIPNKQRCETCDKCEKPSFEQRIKGQFPYCNEGDFSIGPDLEDTIALVGCASHSSVQSRDQVLDEVIDYCKEREALNKELHLTYNQPTYFAREIEAECIRQYFELLRTRGSRDP